MKTLTRFAACAFAVVTLLFSGCSKNSHEQIANDLSEQLDKMADTVSSVTDKSSAEKAVTSLKDIAAEVKKIAARAKEAGEPSAEVKTKLEAKMKAKQEEIMKKVMAAQASLIKAGPEASAIVGKGMMEFGSAMEEVGKTFDGAK